MHAVQKPGKPKTIKATAYDLRTLRNAAELVRFVGMNTDAEQLAQSHLDTAQNLNALADSLDPKPEPVKA